LDPRRRPRRARRRRRPRLLALTPGGIGVALRRLRAVVRLVRAVGHGLHGLAIVLFRFPRLAAAERLARIRWWSKKMLHLLGIELRVEGTPLAGGGLLAVNHISWLDIMVVHALVPEARFVSK